MRTFLSLILILVAQQIWAQAPDPAFNDKAAMNDLRIYQKSAKFVESGYNASFDLIYQRLNFKLDPAVNYISGSVLSRVNFVAEHVALISFDLNDALTVDSVFYNREKVSFVHSGNKIAINLPAPEGKTSSGEVEVFYQGAPPQNGLGSFVASKHNNSPVIWTLSEPYGAKDWWPCKESLADKIDSMDVFITCPQQYLAASNGKLISNEVSGLNRMMHWKHRYPIATYLVAIAVTNYQTYSDYLTLSDGKKIEVLNYVYPEYLSAAKSTSPNVLDIFAFYNRKFGPYPFAEEKYGHAQFGWGGGMEHQTMSFMFSLDFELVAHEMAHQWFGDCVTLNSWHDIWLNEGFATYLTGLTYENLLNGQYWSWWKNIQVNKITAVADGAVYVADTTDIKRIFSSRLSYSKGAYLLHMLRWEMGDSAFFAGMYNYLNDPSVKYGFGTQAKFVKHMEAAADTSFTGFFNDWYYGEGYPVYRLTYYTDYTDFGKCKLRISQTSSNSSVGFFEMHVPVRVWKNGKYSDLRLYNTIQDQEFVIADGSVDKIEFDPDKWLIAKCDIVNDIPDLAELQPIRIIPYNELHQIRVLITSFSGSETFRMRDAGGRIVQSGRLVSDNSRIDVSGLSKGIYIVEVLTPAGKSTGKVTIW